MVRLNQEESEEWSLEGAAFGPGPGTSTHHLTEEEAAGVYVQPLAEGQELAGVTQKPLPLCGHAHEDHPCGRDVCAFDRDVKAPIFSRGNYTYIEICGKHGKRAGKRIGYLRVYSKEYARHKVANCYEDEKEIKVGFVTTCGLRAYEIYAPDPGSPEGF